MPLIVVAVILFLHGLAHLAGFAGAWRLVEMAPYQTTLLDGAVDVGDAGARAIGVVWLAVAVGFAVAGVAVLRRAAWWPAFVVLVAMASLLLCLLTLPGAQAGAALDLALILGVLLGLRLGWFEPRWRGSTS